MDTLNHGSVCSPQRYEYFPSNKNVIIENSLNTRKCWFHCEVFDQA
jgi:hypothetical protein